MASGARWQVRRNNFHIYEIRRQRILADEVFSGLLILEMQGLRHNQVLAVRGYLGLSASDFERSHRADFQLLPIVVIKLFRHGKQLVPGL